MEVMVGLTITAFEAAEKDVCLAGSVFNTPFRNDETIVVSTAESRPDVNSVCSRLLHCPVLGIEWKASAFPLRKSYDCDGGVHLLLWRSFVWCSMESRTTIVNIQQQSPVVTSLWRKKE
jgi:hypothetical protein